MWGSTRRWPVVVAVALACAAAGVVNASAANYPQEWPQFGESAGHRGFNPFERAFTRSNIATLSQAWTGAYGSSAADESSPVIAGNVAFIAGADGRVSAFNLQGCFGAQCAPLWTGKTRNDITATPAVWQNELLVASADHNLYAFPAGGCNFQPTCAPLWKGRLKGAVVDSSPAVVNGVAYVGSYGGRLYAFDANGCGTAVCDPIWTSRTLDGHLVAPPAVGHGSVFIGSDNGTFYAFPAAGCGAALCSPTWKATLPAPDFGSGPMVSGDTVYIKTTRLDAFAANGCGAATCTPLWSGDLGDSSGESTTPAVWNGMVFTADQFTPTPGRNIGVVQAFDAAGCGKPLCKASWTGVNFASGFESSPAIANGIVFVAKGPASGFPVDVGMYAYDTRGCGRTVCGPISFVQANIDGNYLGSTPAIADGHIVFGANDNVTGQGTLYAFMP